MKRLWGHVLAGSSALAGLCAIFAACTHDDSSIFVQGVLAQQLVTQGQVCLYTSDPTQPMISSGTLDVDFRNEYDAEFLLANQLVTEVNSTQLQTETSIVNVQGAVVRITDAAGNQLADYTRLSSATINAANGGTPSYAPLNVTVVDTNTVSSISSTVNSGTRVRVIAYVRFFGKTLGGQSVESNEFSFPVDVCKGCLITESAMDYDPLCGYPNCLGSAGSGTAATLLPTPCLPGQDVPVDCSQCQGVDDCRLGVPANVTQANCAAGGQDAGAG